MRNILPDVRPPALAELSILVQPVSDVHRRWDRESCPEGLPDGHLLTLLLAVVVFVLTSIETWVGNRHTSARLNARKYRTWTLRLKSARYAATFEAILVVWIVLGLENWKLMLFAIPGAFAGDLYDTRRKKKRKTVADPQVLM